MLDITWTTVLDRFPPSLAQLTTARCLHTSTRHPSGSPHFKLLSQSFSFLSLTLNFLDLSKKTGGDVTE